MSSKNSHKISNTDRPVGIEAHFRFNKVVLIDNSTIDLFVNEALMRSISISREIGKEIDPKNVIEKLKRITQLKEVPELIFLDLKMENRNGFSFLKEYHRLSDFIRSKCKIVVISSTLEIEDKHRVLMNPGVIECLIKPLDAFMFKEIKYSKKSDEL